MMWQAVGETLVREESRITEAAKQLRAARPAGGSVTVGEVSPAALAAYVGHRVHLHPRGYLRDASPDDVSAGAFYETGGNLYSMGRGMGVNDSKAGALIAWLRQEGVAKAPRRILDLGCSAGASTAPYALAFPEAEVHGVDLGAAMVRYAHARAESLGARVHFHQMDVADLRFPDGHFDLVVSHNLMHEISDETRRRMFGQIARVLAAGGVCILQDVAIRTGGRSLFECAERAWDVEFNDEPYWMEYADAPILEELQAAGFPAGALREFPLPKIEGPGHWYAVMATRAAVAARAA
jgi:SAM-dependent methyltransferase